ncbi:hypothetical protein [Streptomyces albicerus]|uniref:hypothetical protein n=1 Tax=Streptomyces albicerus TaxID=2569859 RepID=UPI00124AFEF4|nr:hypothetical protein [Streptomyces albicerus]
MALDDTSFARIKKLVTDYHAKIGDVRNDDNLSATGQRRALAKLHVTYRDEIKGIRDNANAAYQDRKGYLMGEVFGVHGATNPAEIMAMRDAMTRVADIATPDQARRLFQQAHLTGDEYMRRAIAAHAFSQRSGGPFGGAWEQVFTDYAGTQDERRQGHIAELDQLHQADSKRARFQEQILCGISRPTELDGYGDIDSVATGTTDLGIETEGDAA